MAVCKFVLFEQQAISEMSAYTTGGAMAMATHYELMKKSIELARLSKSEDSKPHPFVGAIAARKGRILATACRGEAPGDHAEFTLIEKKLKNKNLAGCTIYTTLEPCTSRSHLKVPCAKRLIENRVKKVVIGILDPNPIITGRGELALTSAGIETALYPKKLKSEILALNREFIRAQTQPESRGTATEEFI